MAQNNIYRGGFSVKFNFTYFAERVFSFHFSFLFLRNVQT